MASARFWAVACVIVIIWFGVIIISSKPDLNQKSDEPSSKDEQITTVSTMQNSTTTQTTTTTASSNTTIATITTESQKEIVITFLGDCTMASNHGNNYANNMEYYLNNYPSTYFFEKCMPYIAEDDITIANCENVFAPKDAKRIAKDHSPAFWFKTDPCHANVFSDNSIEVVSIANNHINDYGKAGLESTKNALTDNGVLYGEDEIPIITEVKGTKIGILCVTYWSEWYTEAIVQNVTQLTETTDIQIVFFHGGKERLHSPENWKKEGCRKFVDAGADLVIGGHPHVLQPYEEYKGASIIYSIGNFCFGGNRSPENRTVLYQQKITVNEKSQIVKSEENIIPFYVYTGTTNNWQPAPIEDEKIKEQVLNFVYQKSNKLF